MRETKKVVCFFIFCLLIIIFDFGQAEEQEQKTKTKVMVQQEGEDTIGIRLSYEIKEKIRSSFGYELVNSYKEADLRLAIISVPIKMAGFESVGSAISVVYIYEPAVFSRFINHGIIVISKDSNIESRAGEIVGSMDKYYQEQRSNLEFSYEALITGIKVLYKDKK